MGRKRIREENPHRLYTVGIRKKQYEAWQKLIEEELTTTSSLAEFARHAFEEKVQRIRDRQRDLMRPKK